MHKQEEEEDEDERTHALKHAVHTNVALKLNSILLPPPRIAVCEKEIAYFFSSLSSPLFPVSFFPREREREREKREFFFPARVLADIF